MAVAPMPRHVQQNGSNDRPGRGATPLLVHFDVNKTVIQSDSIQMKGIEDGIREGIAELFWGHKIEDANGKLVWEWTKHKPSCYPPVDESDNPARIPVNYFEFCRSVVKDKQDRKEIVNTFKLVGDEARVEMDKLLQVTLKKMQLSPEIRFTKQAEEAGLKGSTISMFPTLFHFVAALQRSKRIIAILFRSFGADHETIKAEWNAFCEMKHPVYSKFLEGVGPLDGTIEGVPDRRIHHFHTMYRDAEGPVLILDTFTNGPPERTWDSWAKGKPKPKVDDRKGRDYYRNELKAEAIEGMIDIQKWMRDHIFNQGTAAIKDDWAWWQFHGEQAHAGKLLTLIGGPEETEQLFFDDNIDINDTRIVDCRDVHGEPVPGEFSINRVCTKVNPVEALLDDGYFLRKLQLCHGEHLDLGASLIDFQRQLTEVEDQKSSLQKQVKGLLQQLKTLTDENRRMKLLHRIPVKDESHLRELLAKEFESLEIFKEANGFRTISDLWWELENGHCWLELDEHGKLVRSFEMVFIKLVYKTKNPAEDLILIESHEQGSDGRVQSRNYLPGARKALRETSFNDTLAQWVERRLSVDLSSVVAQEGPTVFAPEAPNQQTGETQAYPIPCRIQQSEATFILASKAYNSHADLLQRIGLPGGKHFPVSDPDLSGGVVTRFFRWDKMATWEASLASASRLPQKGTDIDIAEVCDKLFRGHPRQEVYENLLLQMFELFTAKKLCGGFSGSVVIRVQPYEPDGRPGEPCIVKLDHGKAIREEFENSNAVFKALPDRAARIQGDAAYATNKADSKEYGAMRLELAGACWNVPELAQGSANLLSTFKDLLLYESEQIMVGSTSSTSGDIRPFGNVHSVLAETFGPGGVVAALRKGGSGLRRATGQPLLWGWYTLKGKKGPHNPYFAQGQYTPEPMMRTMYKEYFGEDMPPVNKVVDKIRPMLEDLAQRVKDQNVLDLCPLVGLAHGDLNAANIMIDALDAVWLIDFATSVDLPLFTDMCKFEMACLFEYAVLPVTPKMLLSFGSTEKAAWKDNNIGDWLRIDQAVADLLMIELCSRGMDRVSRLTEAELDELIEEVAANSGKAPHKQREIIRSIKARLCIDTTEVACAYKYCRKISATLLKGDYIFESLSCGNAPHIDPVGPKKDQGARSLKYFMDIAVSVRRFMFQDITGTLRDYQPVAEGVQACDALSLQLWLPILRESYRLIGYSDIPPQHKLWSIYNCNLVAKNVLSMLATIEAQFQDLKALTIMDTLRHDLANQSKSKSTGGDLFIPLAGFTEAASHWIYGNAAMFPADAHQSVADKVVRQVHVACPLYSTKPGFFAPIVQVTDKGNTPLRLSFADNTDIPGSFKLYLRGDFENLGINVDPDAGPPFDTAVSDGIGCVTLKPGTKEVESVTLKSRLLFLTIALLKLRLEDEDDSDGEDNFDISEWSGHMFKEGEDMSMSSKSTRTLNRNPSRQASESEKSVPASFKFQIIAKLEATAKIGKGEDDDIDGIRISLGAPTLCYPPGANLCIDTTVVQQQRSASPVVVVVKLNESGTYRVRDAENPTQDSERDFGPTCKDHVYLTPTSYKKKQKVIVNKDGTSWIDCEIVEVASADNCWRYRMLSTLPQVSEVSDNKMGLMSGQDVPQETQAPTERVLWQVSTMNSGPALLSAAAYEEEVHKMKVYFRARHSFIIDGLSGMRLGIKSCAVPTLHLQSKREDNLGGGLVRTTSAVIGSVSGSTTPASVTSKLSSRKMSFMDVGGASTPEVRHGWTMLTKALEGYETSTPSCSTNAFLILGSPGSGKSCLICRLIMDCLERHQNVVPVLIFVSDLVKRSEPDADIADMDSAAVSAWFDKYLMLTFGEDSLRYKMVRQAIQMHRVLFLFEALEDGGTLTPIIEHLIKDIVLDRHLVVVTTRPFVSGTPSFVGMDEHIATMELQSLTDEQQRSIAHARLGLSGLASLDQFMKQLRESQSVTGDVQEGDGQENVFGNPMMLSMLLCYLQMKQKEKDEREASGERKEDDSDNVTITAVYRVAVDVMLNRVQSKQQADRHNKDEKVDQCKRILEKMALDMQVMQRTSIDATAFEKGIDSHLRSTWYSLKDAVAAGHAMFLRTSQSQGDRVELHFLVKGFQHYFAASGVANQGGKYLPGLVSLLTEPSWAPMLEMLAEANGYKYVQLIESHLDTFVPEKGNTFLHLAAQVGHRPVFQLLPLFTESHQAALSTPNAEKQIPLHLAAEKGNTQLCALMLQHKAPIDVQDSRGALPMHVALQHRQFPTAKFLLDKYEESQKRSLGSRRPGANKEEDSADQLAAKMLSSELDDADFKSDMDEVFSELRYFGKTGKNFCEQSKGALLAVFWIVCNRYDQFVRSQPPEKRLTPESWQKMTNWTTETVQLTERPAKVGAMLVFVAIDRLGKIPQLKKAFTPHLEDPTEALRSILQKSPILIPSFARLEADLQHMITAGLKASDFNFGQFLQAENLPASLVIVKDILGDKEAASANTLGFFLFRLFASMCSLFAVQNNNVGSLFMNESQFTTFFTGLEVLQHLTEETPQQIYHRFLAKRANAQGLPFDARDSRSVALVRLACLARAFEPQVAGKVKAAWEALDPQESAALTGYLNADGINGKGILPYNAPALFEKAMANKAVGLLAGMKMMLRIYKMAEKEYEDSDKMLITIFFDQIKDFAGGCKELEVFEFAKFEISRTPGSKADCTGVVRMSPWQLVRDREKLEKLAEDADTLVQETMNQMVRENLFYKRLDKVFLEMKFFDQKSSEKVVQAGYKQTLGALVAAFWLASDHAEAFTRGQPTDRKLSGTSWKKATTMPGSRQSDILNVVYVAAVVHGVAKIPKFAAQLAPHATSIQEVLMHVMDTCPEVLPSYMRLSASFKDVVRWCVSQNFDFEEWMNAESLPASLADLKRSMLQLDEIDEGQMYLPTYLQFVFASLSGSLFTESTEGSLYMTDDAFSKFESAVEIVQQLMQQGASGTEQAVYDQLLSKRAANLQIDFIPDDPASRAATRLACWAEVADEKESRSRISVTLQKDLSTEEREKLTSYLVQDGISIPGYVLSGVKAFFKSAQEQPKVGLAAAIRTLLKVCEAADELLGSSRTMIFRIQLGGLTAAVDEYAGPDSLTDKDCPFELMKSSDSEAVVVPNLPQPPPEEHTREKEKEKEAETVSSPKLSPAEPAKPLSPQPKAPPSPIKIEKENGNVQDDAKLRAVMEELVAMQKQHESLRTEHTALREVNRSLVDEKNASVSESQIASDRLQNENKMLVTEAERLKRESEDLRIRLREGVERQAREVQRDSSDTAMLKMECEELRSRTGALSQSEARQEREACQLRGELASAEAGLSGLNMEIGELTMELAKLRAQAASDARLQRSSSEARIELLELRRQLLGRETMLGHEREVADKRLEAARRETVLMNERLDVAMRERDWAMQELHVARRDERLAAVRSRTLAEEGVGLRSRCDALEAAHRAMMYELEVLRGSNPMPGGNSVVSPSSSSVASARATSPLARTAGGVKRQSNGGSPVLGTKIEAPPPMVASAYASIGGVSVSGEASASPGVGTPGNSTVIRNTSMGPSASSPSSHRTALNRVGSRTTMPPQQDSARYGSVRQTSAPMRDWPTGGASNTYPVNVGPGGPAPAHVVVNNMLSPVRTPRTSSPVGSGRTGGPDQGQVQVIRAPHVTDGGSARSNTSGGAGAPTVLRRMVPQSSKSTGNLARYVERGSGSPGPHLRTSLQARQPGQHAPEGVWS